MQKVIRIIIIAALLGAGWYGYRHYRVNTAQLPMVEVETGEEKVCAYCGKVVERNVQVLRVPMDQETKFWVKKVEVICSSCQQKR